MFLEQTMHQETLHFKVNMWTFTNANFAVAAVLISFGGLLGKISPTQVTVVVLMEILVYCLNKVYFLENWLSIVDVGGSIIIHAFGAYFGLACSAMLGKAT